MKIFISWSGKSSLGVATALRDWLPYIFNGIELFVSSEDIRKGKRWPLEVSKELDASNFGIVCLTQDNLEAPWLLFESGALSKSIKESSLFTLLVGGLRVSDVEGPLSHFQHTIFEKEDFFKLVRCINEANGSSKQDEGRLRKIFDKFWEELETAIAKAITVKAEARQEKKRTSEDMLRELLELTSYIAKQIPKSEQRSLLEEVRTIYPDPADQEFWKKFTDRAGKASPFVRTYLLESKGSIVNQTLTISFPTDCKDHAELVNNKRNNDLFRRILSEMGYGSDCKIIFKLVPSFEDEKR